jgi:HicA toxin of bacterial toxin-antitoxin,
VTKFRKQLAKVLDGTADKSFAFVDLCTLLKKLGFEERIKGSHHIFWRNGVEEIINLQKGNDGNSKPYQMKQVREIIILYKLVNEIE